MALDCLVSKPLRKQMFHQDYFDLRSLIIIKDEEALYMYVYNVYDCTVLKKTVE